MKIYTSCNYIVGEHTQWVERSFIGNVLAGATVDG